ncbi:lipoprotein insertase outer membrane protein LolB [Acidovorax radicis]|uniref:lipoprotein insertase outer membrane protein LolB n=1 Tax=Acidovorax radicis TaxID=758826 RepID=UPI0039AFA95A|nr:DUF3261 domain-containing protein [Acidovorax radicis]
MQSRPVCAASRPHRWMWWFVLGLLWMTGCAQPARQIAAEEPAWSGRIALQVEDQSSQSFSAMFELHGNAQNGGLVLLSPLGSRLAQLDWQNGHAQLQSGQETRSSDSLDSLLQEVTGTRIPIEALFGWLQGVQVSATGWQADLSGIASGRLTARRDDPAPKATLRIALTR